MKEDELITIEFKYTRADFIGAYRLSGGWKRHVYGAAVFFAMAGPVLYQALHDEKYELLGIAGFLLAIVPALLVVGRNDYIRTLVQSHDRGPQKIVFLDTGLRHLGPHGEALTPWGEFTEARVGPDVALLFTGPNRFRVIPLRSVPPLDSMDKLLGLIEEKISRGSRERPACDAKPFAAKGRESGGDSKRSSGQP